MGDTGLRDVREERPTHLPRTERGSGRQGGKWEPWKAFEQKERAAM